MFDYSSMLKRAIEYFPIWTDIRKRHTKSIGGKAVASALNETLELEAAIQQYIDFYFLEKYKGKENEIIAFVYAAKTGLIKDFENVTLKYNEKEYIITGNIDEFYSNSNLAYYEDGSIYLQECEIKDNNIIIMQKKQYYYEKISILSHCALLYSCDQCSRHRPIKRHPSARRWSNIFQR